MTFIKKKFKELVDYKSGYTWSKDQELKISEPNSIRVLTVSNIQAELDLSSVLYLKNVAQKDRLNKAASKNWSIAVSSNGNRKRIGNAIFIDEDTEYLYASFLTGFIPKENSGLLPEYFFRWFSSYEVQEKISEVAEGTTELRNMSLRHLRNSFIEYPENPAEQRTIASILSKVDEAIAATKNSIAKAERLKKALMQNLLTGKLKPDGTWRNEEEFYKDEKFGDAPIGWKYDKLETTLSDCQYGINAISVEGGNFPMFRMNNIVDGRMIAEPMAYINLDPKTFKKYRVNRNDILFNRTNSLDLVGKLGIFKLDGDFVFASYLIRLAVNDDNCPDFINYQLNSYKGQCNLRAKATPSVSQANINAGNVKKLIVIIPPKSEQEKIAAKISGIENVIYSKQTKVKKLERLKKALMQNLLTGKVRLPDKVIAKAGLKVPKEQLQTEIK